MCDNLCTILITVAPHNFPHKTGNRRKQLIPLFHFKYPRALTNPYKNSISGLTFNCSRHLNLNINLTFRQPGTSIAFTHVIRLNSCRACRSIHSSPNKQQTRAKNTVVAVERHQLNTGFNAQSQAIACRNTKLYS